MTVFGPISLKPGLAKASAIEYCVSGTVLLDAVVPTFYKFAQSARAARCILSNTGSFYGGAAWFGSGNQTSLAIILAVHA